MITCVATLTTAAVLNVPSIARSTNRTAGFVTMAAVFNAAGDTLTGYRETCLVSDATVVDGPKSPLPSSTIARIVTQAGLCNIAGNTTTRNAFPSCMHSQKYLRCESRRQGRQRRRHRYRRRRQLHRRRSAAATHCRRHPPLHDLHCRPAKFHRGTDVSLSL